jgi:ribosome-associated toxin RatA of RatAB toxin-antitoxin module
MALVEKSMLVEYPAETMFSLVDDVTRYPEFLPWCGGAEILDRDEHTVHAALLISYKGIKQRFSTRNRAEAPQRIEITLVEGPFRHLDGRWSFTALGPQACKVEFALHYEFASKLLEKLVGPVFNYIANSFVDAFIKRAESLFGKR